MILGDLGADVFKVEPPEGDLTRTWGPPFLRGQSGYHPRLGDIQQLAFTVRASTRRAEMNRAPPQKGEHTRKSSPRWELRRGKGKL